MKEKFALIGKTLKHSYSKKIHTLFSKYEYDLVELESDALERFVKESEYKGFNVTIPYKQQIMPYLDYIDESAKAIGAVNTVVKRNGKTIGYNTDFLGMIYMLKKAEIELHDRCVLILGSGGTRNTALAVAKTLGAKSVKTISRNGEYNYQNCYDLIETEVIINTTPVGMYPETDNCPIDINRFPNLLGVADVIYNPSLTKLLFNARERGIKYTNGLSMLVAQAKYAMDLFLSDKFDDGIVESVLEKLQREVKNIVLVGMPGSGKSTVANNLSALLDMESIDIDQKIEQKAGKSIPEIFSNDGEDYFRSLETEVIKEFGCLSGKIISTGGGAVKRAENYFLLKQNGVIFYIDRPIEKLSTVGRPLSKDLTAVKKLFEERKELYEKFADFTIDNGGSLEDTVKGVIDLL